MIDFSIRLWRERLRNREVLAQLIAINIVVFLIVKIVSIIAIIGGSNTILDYSVYTELPSDLHLFLLRPWTIISYMFVHYDFGHIFFNIIGLHWFGKIFMKYFSPKQLGSLYILGGIGGGALFLLCYNFIPFFADHQMNTFLIGASASVLAIVVATSLHDPDYELFLLLVGRVKIKYLALILLVIDFLSITSSNAGGHIAHLGGAFIGFLFALFLRKGTDITASTSRWIDRFANLLSIKHPKRKKIRFENYAKMEDVWARKSSQTKNDQINAILDKIKTSGYNSLSADEKQKLFEASKK